MSFASWAFVGLCGVVFALYYLPFFRRAQPLLLIVASLFFYAYDAPALLSLLAASVIINAVASWQVAVRPVRERLAWAVAGVAFNVLLLIAFKYTALLARLMAHLLSAPDEAIPHALLQIPLPIGISFYTFEGISLVVDVLRGRDDRAVEARLTREVASHPFLRHLLHTSLFIVFYPHLAAGPILRASAFMPQIRGKRLWDIPWDEVSRMLILGFFLKMVVANNLAEYTKWLIYPRFCMWGGITNLVLLCSSLVRLFADFAGYSYIAIGVGLLFGYRLPLNFDRPFLSASVNEFWMRWHITLSTWLRDYLYKPLRGISGNSLRADMSLLTVLLIGGLWHGAAWHYLFWGGYLGMAMLIERLWMRRKAALGRASIVKHSPMRVLGVFLFCVSSMVWFQLPDLVTAWRFIGALLHPFSNEDVGQILTILLYCIPIALHHLIRWDSLVAWMRREKPDAIWYAHLLNDLGYGVMLALIVVNSGDTYPFLYFQF